MKLFTSSMVYTEMSNILGLYISMIKYKTNAIDTSFISAEIFSGTRYCIAPAVATLFVDVWIRKGRCTAAGTREIAAVQSLVLHANQ